ncbi:desumoylating isopeptidase 1 [Aspergillus udagawae]|uniref:Desumoylating isopeptidase 1 n=1 Tax=Aspergillus udagawae TaxID=91492 RepID=A0ABQ1A1R5_9EURO|nr:desumoylating isopeptidase 1 [Aspergillus udagawae]GFF71468.1 desumoylating isopeptidase 1 [Aspergillus udagawae]
MDVELYVYDLSKGLARMYSLALTGTYIDAIYHTSIVLNGVEYYFGQGIQTSVPGSTHHGQPMEKLLLGKTELPVDVVEEYIQSLTSIYTPESYDLFLHNCNNFTQDLAMFLVGKSIPEHIQNLPQTFLSTPFGQMMKPQIEQALRGVTQAAAPAPQPLPRAPVTAAAPVHPGTVRQVSNVSQLEEQLESAVNSCAVIFFTSATCPPCKVVYPTYDELAEEAGDKAVLIKVDISAAYDVSMKYGVRATPTFMTILKGNKLDEWSGADPAKLRGNVRLLIEMAHPTHRHRQLRLPSFQRHLSNFVMYKKVPPLDKLVQKLQPHHEDPRLKSMIAFITARSSSTTPTSPAADVALPDALPTFASYLQSTFHALPPENHFALVDLARLLFVDTRVSSFFAEEPNHTTLLTLLSPSTNLSSCPYNLRIVMLQLICNLFSSPLYLDPLTTNSANNNLHTTVLTLTTSSLLDPHPNLRTVAASLAYNLSAANHNARFAGLPDKLTEEEQVELTASLVEAITQEAESAEALHGLLFALGLLVYEAPADGAVVDLCRAMGIAETVRAKGEMPVFAKELIREVGGELLGKGL